MTAVSIVSSTSHSDHRRKEMLRFAKAISLILTALLVASLLGCAPAPKPPEEATQPPQVVQSKLTFGLAVHSNPAEDLFWGVVEKGAKDAAATYGIKLKSGGSGKPSEQAQLIEN